MAQNVTVAGASYSDVPAILLPKTGGGSAKFVDTSGDTVAADKLLAGYTAHDSTGALITGSVSSDYIQRPAAITAGDTVVLTSSVMMAKALGSGGNVVPTNMSITIPKAGTYRFKFATYNGRVAANYTRAQLRKNGSAVGSECGSNAAANAAYEYSLDLECAANDVIYLHAYNATNTLSAAGAVGALRACIDWEYDF